MDFFIIFHRLRQVSLPRDEVHAPRQTYLYFEDVVGSSKNFKTASSHGAHHTEWEKLFLPLINRAKKILIFSFLLGGDLRIQHSDWTPSKIVTFLRFIQVLGIILRF